MPRFKECRIAKGLDQSQAAKLLGIARNTLWRIETGLTTHIDTDVLCAMSKAYGQTTDYLLNCSEATPDAS
jgi:transcriptional regulator with XRE-family HTH domain